MGKLFVFLLAFITTGILIYLIDIYITEEYFCAQCNFDEHSILYSIFYYNNSESGYNSNPTKFHLAVILFFSFYVGLFCYHKTPSSPKKEKFI
jgi:hypothetical protein